MECIAELIERYFEAALTEEEETALKAFLASEEGQYPEYDEVRAVMGYFAAGRSIEILRSHTLPQNDMKHFLQNDRKRSPVILSGALSLPKGEAKDLSSRWSETPPSSIYPDRARSAARRRSLRHKATLWPRVVAAAASLAIIVTIGVNIYNKENICVSFVGGQKVTDKEFVMNDVDNILADLLSDRVDMEEQLVNIFGE